ncbi:MAG: hypothetical protein ACI870_000245 [Crocinitomicaceae bacterium]|jgi:hypothetical protein
MQKLKSLYKLFNLNYCYNEIMKKIIIVIITLIVLGGGWYLLSPLFINETVEESLPIIITSLTDVEIPDDIILDQDTIMDELMVEINSTTNVIIAGNFAGADARHEGSGQLKIISDGNQQYLRFEDFSVTNGPDLFVTLNKGNSPEGGHVLIEALKGNEGNQNYDISKYDISDYQSVSIYCRAFSVEFATAQL